VIQAKRLKAWWLLLLLVLIPLAHGEAAAPNLVGVWKGTAPEAGPGYCLNENLTLTITKQCGNLIRGKATIWTSYTFDFLGSIKEGTMINIHGCPGSSFFLMGEYQAGSPAKIIVTYLYAGQTNTQYDTFPASYSGKVKQGSMAAFDLLLLE